MNLEPSRTVKLSCRSQKSSGRISPNVDFTLYGSPAPRSSHRSVKPRKPSQPPNTPVRSAKPRRPLKLPIDKILLLNEKIEHEKKEKIRLELSSRQIKLTSDREEDDDWPKSGKSCSSAIDLSIDLSTVTNSDRESDTNSDDLEEFVSDAMLPKKKTSPEPSSGSDGPSRYIWRLEKPKTDFLPASERSTSTEYPIFEETPTNGSLVNQSPKCFRSRSADLIHLYVSTINHKDELTKYFRPCHVCNNTCCICPDLVPESSRSFPIPSTPATLIPKPGADTLIECKKDKMVETDPEITQFRNPVIPETIPDSSSESENSEFSNFLVERYLQNTREEYEIRRNDSDMIIDSGNSTLQLDEVNESDGSCRQKEKKSVPLSVVQLATAAQCARVLANSLESVLETFESDRDEFKNLIRFKSDDLNELFHSLLSLKSHMQHCGKTEDWVDFRREESSVSRQHISQSINTAFPGFISSEKSDFNFEDNFDGNFISGGNQSD